MLNPPTNPLLSTTYHHEPIDLRKQILLIMTSSSPLLNFITTLIIIIISACNAAPNSGIPSTANRKMLHSGACSNRDISISQSRDPGPGIPRFIVQIANTCVSGCAPSRIHLHCGWFASAKMVNPRSFKRIGYDDCVVNAGKPLKRSQIVRFTYSNSFMYPLLFKSAIFC